MVDGDGPKRVLAYDLLRILAAVTVVVIHVMAAYLSNRSTVASPDLGLVLANGLHYAVPLFTFLSGVLSWGVVWSRSAGAYRRFMRSRFARIGVPYLFWSVVYYLLRPVAGVGKFPVGVMANVRRFAILFISGDTWYHLYYLPMILVLLAFTPLASRLVHRAPEVLVLLAVAIRVLGFETIVGIVGRLPWDAAFQPLATDVLRFLPYMALGAWYAVRRHQVSGALRMLAPLLFVCGIWLSAAQTLGWIAIGASWYAHLIDVATMYCMVLGFVGVAEWTAAVGRVRDDSRLVSRLVTLSGLTFGVYLVHPLVIFAGRKLVGVLGIGAGWNSLLFVAAFSVLALIGSFGLAAMLNRSRLMSRFV